MNGLLCKLIKRNAPVEFIRILYSWLNDVRCSVDWLSMLSDLFIVHCGIRQGGILSPILFSVYVDDLIGQLRASGYISTLVAFSVGAYCMLLI